MASGKAKYRGIDLRAHMPPTRHQCAGKVILDVVDMARNSDVKHFHCVGIGAGPANLSLASLLHGHPEVTNCFVERRRDFGWHDGQQTAGASLHAVRAQMAERFAEAFGRTAVEVDLDRIGAAAPAA